MQTVAIIAVTMGSAGVLARTQLFAQIGAQTGAQIGAQTGTHSPLGSQLPSASQSTDPTRPGSRDDMTQPNEVAARQSRARNDERQRRLVADTDKLLSLATSLHDDVAKTNKDVLSLDVVRRAEEIEKLAKSVKERMKG